MKKYALGVFPHDVECVDLCTWKKGRCEKVTWGRLKCVKNEACEKSMLWGAFPSRCRVCRPVYVECVDLYTLSVASGTGRQGRIFFEKCDRLKCVKKYALGGFSLTM